MRGRRSPGSGAPDPSPAGTVGILAPAFRGDADQFRGLALGPVRAAVRAISRSKRAAAPAPEAL